MFMYKRFPPGRSHVSLVQDRVEFISAFGQRWELDRIVKNAIKPTRRVAWCWT